MSRSDDGPRARRFPARPESAARARRFVRDALDGAAPRQTETAELLTGELVTNAVLHARTEVSVEVRRTGGTVRVGVGDGRPDRPPVSQRQHPYTATGWGLALVERLAGRHGVDTAENHKAVWFELAPRADAPAPGPAGFAVPASGPTGSVTLVDLPFALYSASQAHRRALLRELVLAAAAGDDNGVRPADLATAQDANDMITACVAAAAQDQHSGTDIRTLLLAVPPDVAPTVRTLRRVLDLAETAARRERLLSRPALPHLRAFHRWLFDEITGQFTGGVPGAWTLVPREPSARPSELNPWDARQVLAGRVPTIAADDADRIIAVNGPAADLLGRHPDDLVGQRITTLMPAHLRDRHVQAFSSLLRTGRPRILGRSVPLPALHSDGRLIPVRLFIQTQEAADGRTVFVAQLIPRSSTLGPSPDDSAWPETAGHHGIAGHETDTETESAPVPAREPVPRRPPPVAEGPEGGREDRLARTALQRLALVADTYSALAAAPDAPELLRRVGEILVGRFADWYAVDLLDARDQVERVCVVHRDPAAPPSVTYEGALPPVSGTGKGPLPRALRGAGPLLLTDIPPDSGEGSALDARQSRLFAELGAHSAVVAPLQARRQVLGALTVARTGGQRPFTEEDLPLLGDVAGGLALGVDNAHLYQETRQIAERLQRSLLPALPRTEHFRLAARYAPSSATAHVGGDWYDAFMLPGGEAALVIGDVTGHDLQAAVAMSSLRNMLRGIAVDRQEPPGEVLRRLDLASQTLYRNATATCLYGMVRGTPGAAGAVTLHYATAGHLPPLLTTAQGETRHLEAGAGALIGMDPELPRPTGCETLPPHSTLLLYTDGLIERRGEHLDDAMTRLRRCTADLARAPLDVFCDEVLLRLGADSTDDIALLALRVTPP
ncbi:PAS domain S-box-containing protein [Streptomyces sp. B3I7]|uniref:SpoIIE family protein phosphatase n=1 Tax=Streptomyces sp. B3I7 TaxID=3042269 RepID=UPI00278AEE9A|nr:SpoIIE family protein phosphatase [Streptomyces sp. B3I7]MDQ0809013.1 PAS domain S-box-containing protein [Streptomyces sp. B3I7]